MLSMIRHPYLIRHALRHRQEFLLGFREGDGDVGMTYDDDPWSSRSLAYDSGRDLRKMDGDSVFLLIGIVLGLATVLLLVGWLLNMVIGQVIPG